MALSFLLGCLRNVYRWGEGVGGGLRSWAVAGFNGQSVGLYEGVEDGIREYCLRVIEMVVFSKLSVDMEFLCCVKVCSFFVAVYYIHGLVHGAKQMGFFYQVYCKIGGIAFLLHAVLCSL